MPSQATEKSEVSLSASAYFINVKFIYMHNLARDSTKYLLKVMMIFILILRIQFTDSLLYPIQKSYDFSYILN